MRTRYLFIRAPINRAVRALLGPDADLRKGDALNYELTSEQILLMMSGPNLLLTLEEVLKQNRDLQSGSGAAARKAIAQAKGKSPYTHHRRRG